MLKPKFLKFCLAALAALAACNERRPAVSPVVSSDQLAVEKLEDKPDLVTLERDGDGYSSIAAAVVHGGTRRVSSRIATELTNRLGRAGLAADSQVFEGGLVVRVSLWTIDAASDQSALSLLKEALVKPFSPTSKQEKAEAANEPGDVCGVLGDTTSVQAIQQRIGTRSIALAAVGDSDAIRAIKKQHATSGTWPLGERWQADWPKQDSFTYVSGSQASLSVGVRTSRVASLWGAAEILGEENSLVARLAEVSGWEFTEPYAGLLAEGGCVALTFTRSKPGRKQPDGKAEALARAARQEIKFALEEASPVDPAAFALTALDPRDAASKAAWAALSQKANFPTRASGVLVGPVNDRTVAFPRADAAPLSMQLRVRTEPGQGRLHALLTHDCPTRHESDLDAGHSAVALQAAANTDSSLDAWVSARGLGLFAQRAAVAGQSPQQLARRIAQSLLHAETHPASFAIARRQLSELLPADPAWELALDLASNGRPSQLFPPGTAGSLGAVTAARGRAALDGFIAGPLTLLVLSPTDEEVAEQVHKHLATLLAPIAASESSPCPKAPKTVDPSQLAGQYTVRSEQDTAYLVWQVPPGERPQADFVALLLRQQLLKSSLAEPGLVQSFEAFSLGTGQGLSALVVRVTAPRAQLDPAIMQTRALMQRVSGGGVVERHYASTKRAWETPPAPLDPQQRLLDLWMKPGPVASIQAVKRFAGRSLNERSLIVVRPDAAD